jgi:hypothetical protein
MSEHRDHPQALAVETITVVRCTWHNNEIISRQVNGGVDDTEGQRLAQQLNARVKQQTVK